MTSRVNHIDYRMKAGEGPFSLSTGLSDDYACFAIWEGALHKEQEIIRDLEDSFHIVGNFLVHWSRKHYSRNIARLYERWDNSRSFEGYSKKIGKPPFRFLVVKDPNPIYTWKESVSGKIEPSNENVVAAKYRYRSMFEQKYQVHSSNNYEEFITQSALILGTELLRKVIDTKDVYTAEIEKDLEGADGWNSWNDLFSILNLSSNYVVLRNFGGLPNEFDGGDIDFLCDDFQRLASAANVYQFPDRPFKGEMTIAGEKIPTDIRFLGDGYYCAIWEKEILNRRSQYKGMYVPSKDDHFFSLLYHCLVHKGFVKNTYKDLLIQLAEEMRFDWFDSTDLSDLDTMGRKLAGYFEANGYYYSDPVDRGVGAEAKIIKHLPRINPDQFKHKTKKGHVSDLILQGIKRPHRIPLFLAKKFMQLLKAPHRL